MIVEDFNRHALACLFCEEIKDFIAKAVIIENVILNENKELGILDIFFQMVEF